MITLPIHGWQVLCVTWGSLASQPHIILWSFWEPFLKLHAFRAQAPLRQVWYALLILVSSHTGHYSPFQQPISTGGETLASEKADGTGKRVQQGSYPGQAPFPPGGASLTLRAVLGQHRVDGKSSLLLLCRTSILLHSSAGFDAQDRSRFSCSHWVILESYQPHVKTRGTEWS